MTLPQLLAEFENELSPWILPVHKEWMRELLTTLLNELKGEIMALKPVADIDLRNGAWLIEQDTAAALITSKIEGK